MNALWNKITDGTLTRPQLELLDRYLDLLIEKNQVINLTRITDRQDAEIKHVADSLTLLPYLPRGKNLKLADVGTGGGIPGIMIAIARPDIHVTLIDSTRKKLDAVMQMSDAIGLKNVRAVHVRMEELDEKFDILTARGVAELDKLLEWCKPLMKKSSMLFAMKGPKIAEEMQRLSPTKRKQWEINIEPAAMEELTGHCIVNCKLKIVN